VFAAGDIIKSMKTAATPNKGTPKKGTPKKGTPKKGTPKKVRLFPQAFSPL